MHRPLELLAQPVRQLRPQADEPFVRRRIIRARIAPEPGWLQRRHVRSSPLPASMDLDSGETYLRGTAPETLYPRVIRVATG